MTLIALDTETTGLDLFHGCMPFLVNTIDEEGAYNSWEFEVNPLTREVLIDEEKTYGISDYLQGKDIVFQHAVFDLRCLALLGIHVTYQDHCFLAPHSHHDSGVYLDRPEIHYPVVADLHDTQLMSHTVNSQGAGASYGEDRAGKHGLKPLGLFYLDIPEDDEKLLRQITVKARRKAKSLGWKLGTDLSGDPQVAMDYWMPAKIAKEHPKLVLPSERETWSTICKQYCDGDVYRTIGLYFLFQRILEESGNIPHYQRERDLIPVTYMIEHTGMPIDKNRLHQALVMCNEEANAKRHKAEKILGGIVGRDNFNTNSGQQLGEALKAVNAPIKVFTPSGLVGTDAEALTAIAQSIEETGDNNRVAEALREIVGYNPEYNDDVEKAIPGYKTFVTGVRYLKGYKCRYDSLFRVHPSYNQVGTAWTRYASYEPNGQNISKKAVLPLRYVFGPPAGYVWFPVDYSQLELRLFAFAAKDKKLIAAFDSGFDFHTFTAMNMYGVPGDKITSEQRRFAKNVNFGIIFGAGPKKIDYQTGQPGTYAKYMAQFPDAKAFMSETIERVEEFGTVHTLTGYPLTVPQDTPHKGVNAIVQGTAGDLMKYAMIEIHKSELVDWAPISKDLPYGGSSIVANIHDELIFQFPKSYPWLSIGKACMKVMADQGTKYNLVTPVDAKWTDTNWTEGKKVV